MSHIDMRDLDETDIDAVIELVGEARRAGRTTLPPLPVDDADAAREWVLRRRKDGASFFLVTDDGVAVGVAAAFYREGEREISLTIAPRSAEHDAGAAALLLLIGREPDRPLYMRAHAQDASALDVAAKAGFTELSRTAHDVVLVLPPTLE